MTDNHHPSITNRISRLSTYSILAILLVFNKKFDILVTHMKTLFIQTTFAYAYIENTRRGGKNRTYLVTIHCTERNTMTEVVKYIQLGEELFDIYIQRRVIRSRPLRFKV